MKAFLAKLYSDLKAIASVEYAVIAAILALAILGCFTVLSGKLLVVMNASPI